MKPKRNAKSKLADLKQAWLQAELRESFALDTLVKAEDALVNAGNAYIAASIATSKARRAYRDAEAKGE